MPPSPEQTLDQARRLYQAGEFAAAAKTARPLVKAHPDHPGALHLLGAALARLGETSEARRHLRKAIRAVPNRPRVHFDLAYTYHAEDKPERALEVLRRALRDCPHDAYLLRATSETLRMLKRHDEARDLLRPAIDAGSAEPDVLVAFAVACVRGRRPQEAIDLVEPRLADAGMSDRDRMHVLFALAHCHEDVDDFEGAFELYAQANALKGARFDPEAHDRAIDRVIEAWTPEAVAALPRPEIDTSRAVLVCGMPRSGTSLVEQILSIHPDVAAGGELNRLTQILEPCRTAQTRPSPYVHEPGVFTQERVDRVAREYLDVLRAVDAKTRYVTDKVPGNAMRLGDVGACLPGASVILCRRDPVDTGLSCFTYDFGGNIPWAYDLAHIGSFHRAHDRLVAHWLRVLPLRIHEVVYEDLVRDQEPATRAMLGFLGLDWHEPCLRPHESDRLTKTASMDQVRRPVYTSAIGRAERFGPALDPLRKALGGRADEPIP